MILRFLFPLPIFVVIGLIVLLFSGVGIHMAGMMFMMLPMIAVPVVIGWVVLRLLNSDDLLPGNEKRKNEGTKYDYFEPESGDDPAILRTTDGRRYIRTETGEYKEIAE